jgi:glycosyltransferase involved in cell wall biosynthesis
MSIFWKKHIFTAELPYEKDAVVTLFFRRHFQRVDNFIMSLGQMSRIPPSQLYSYEKGRLVNEKTYVRNNLQAAGLKLYFFYIPKALLQVALDLIRALKTIDFRCDIFFAQHFIPAFLAIVLRKVKILRCPKIVFFMYDFFLIPPELLRGLYYRGIDILQRYIRKNVDEIWYTTPRLAECDQQRFGSLPTGVKKRLTEGCFFKRIPTSEPPPIPPLRLAFLGSLRPNNAVYESVDSIWYCLQQGMKVELLIIGSGSEEENLKAYVRKKKISRAVKFYGFEDRGEKIAKIFLSSGKFRRFISQRLPVVATSVPYFVKYLHNYQAGLIVDNDPADIYKALRRIYENPSLLLKLEQGVDKLYADFQVEKVFNEAFNAILNND